MMNDQFRCSVSDWDWIRWSWHPVSMEKNPSIRYFWPGWHRNIVRHIRITHIWGIIRCGNCSTTVPSVFFPLSTRTVMSLPPKVSVPSAIPFSVRHVRCAVWTGPTGNTMPEQSILTGIFHVNPISSSSSANIPPASRKRKRWSVSSNSGIPSATSIFIPEGALSIITGRQCHFPIISVTTSWRVICRNYLIILLVNRKRNTCPA